MAYIPDRAEDQKLEVAMGMMLRIGVFLAALVILIGGAIYLQHHEGPVPDYRTFHSVPSHFRSIPDIVREAAALRGRGIIQLGLLLLIATPVARVVFALGGFALERDWLYTVVSAIVLAILLFSLVHSA